MSFLQFQSVELSVRAKTLTLFSFGGSMEKRIILTRDESKLLVLLAQKERATPGDVVRRLIFREAVRRRLLPEVCHARK